MPSFINRTLQPLPWTLAAMLCLTLSFAGTATAAKAPTVELADPSQASAEGVAAAENYAIADFRSQQARQAQAFHKAEEKAQKKVGAADRARATWESRLIAD